MTQGGPEHLQLAADDGDGGDGDGGGDGGGNHCQ